MEAKEQALEAAAEVRPWVLRLARFGIATKGVVYILVGVLVVQALLGLRRADIDREDVLFAILIQPLGVYLLLAVSIGLLGYVAWRLVQAALDPDKKGSNPGGLIARAGYTISALGYAGLAWNAFYLAASGRPNEGQSVQDITRTIMSYSPGRLLVGGVGLAIIIVGAVQLYLAYKADFDGGFSDSLVSKKRRPWFVRLGRIGYSARGAVYIILGIFLAQAAWRYDPESAAGLGEALGRLAVKSYGPWVLGAVAGGLIAYGIYAVGLALFRRIVLPLQPIEQMLDIPHNEKK
jgi:hypothetical protein